MTTGQWLFLVVVVILFVWGIMAARLRSRRERAAQLVLSDEADAQEEEDRALQAVEILELPAPIAKVLVHRVKSKAKKKLKKK